MHFYWLIVCHHDCNWAWCHELTVCLSVLDSEIISHLVLRQIEWWLWIHKDVHISHENYLFGQAVELQPKVQLYVCSHIVYRRVVIDLHATLACQDSDSVFYTIEINRIYILEILNAGVVACLFWFCFLCTASWQMDLRGPGGGDVLLVKTYWGVLTKFQAWSQATFRISGSQTTDISFPYFWVWN